MSVRDFLRILILGSPLLIPDKKTLFGLFKYEIMKNWHFMVFVVFLAIFNIVILAFIWKSNRFTNLSLGYGILLILCGLILHKIKVVEFINIRNVNEKPTNYFTHLAGIGGKRDGLVLTKSNLFTGSAFKRSKNEPNHDEKPKNEPSHKEKPKNEPSHKERPINDAIINDKYKNDEQKIFNGSNNELIHDEKLNDHNLETKDGKVITKVNLNNKNLNEENKKVNPNKKNVNLNNKNVNLNNKNVNEENKNANLNNKKQHFTREIVDEPKTGLLENFRSVLNQKMKNEQNFLIFLENNKDRKKMIDKLIEDFSSEFDEFLNLSKLISAELFALNASPKYFKFEFNDLKIEISKFFAIQKSNNLKKKMALISYIDNILNLKNITNRTRFISDNNDIIHKVIKFRLLFVSIALICLFFLLSAVLEYFRFYRIFYISICFILIILSLLSICFLLYAHILDKDCKSGRIKGCKMYLNNGSRHISELRQTELFNESEIFKKDLEDFMEDTNINLRDIQNYIHALFSETVSYKILIFKNLFDKLLFVRDDFQEITKDKIDIKKYFSHIRNMYNILDKISINLNTKIKENILQIFMKEIGYGFYINSDKQFIIESVIKAVSEKRSEDDLKLSAKCGTILEKLCMSKEYIEDIFNLLFVFSIVISLFLI